MRNLDKAMRILEFDKIKSMLASFATTIGAKKRALSLTPTSNRIQVLRRQELTQNAKDIACIKGSPSFNNFPEILDSVEKAEKNSILSPREILDVASSLQTARGLIEFIHTDSITKSSLTEMFESLVSNPKLEQRIFKAIIGEDLIADEKIKLDSARIAEEVKKRIDEHNERQN